MLQLINELHGEVQLRILALLIVQSLILLFLKLEVVHISRSLLNLPPSPNLELSLAQYKSAGQ